MGSSSILSSHAFFVLAYPFFVFLVSQLLVGSAGESLFQRCSPFYSKCGEWNISYPFSNDTKVECGLGIIHCVNNSMLQLNNSEDDPNRFEVKRIDYNEWEIVIQDLKFTKLIQANRCNELYNFTIPPISDHLSFHLIDAINLTYLICKGDPSDKEDGDHGLWGFRKCGDNYLHFFPSDLAEPPSSAGDPLQVCKVVEFPMDISGEVNGPLLNRLSGGVRLRWNSSQPCHQCEERGRYCLSEEKQGQLFCADPNDGVKSNKSIYQRKKKAMVITGITAGVGVILLTFLVFVVIYYRRRRKGFHFALFKNRSPSSSLTPLSASIASYPRYGVHLFSYEELEEATDNFNPNQELGDGGFGTVYYGKLRDGREVAVKRLYENNCKRVEQFMNEVEILARLRHKNLVTLYGCTSRHSRELLLVYEFIPNGTVADHLHGDRAESGSLQWPTRMSIALETAQALSFLHASDIIHRDVKTNNILLDKNFGVKVADFGLSRLFPIEVTHVSTTPQGTPGYVDPVYHQCYRLTDKSDVYSFGVVLIELISSKPAVDITRHWHEINLANLAINKIQNRAVHELIDPCLGYDSDDTVKGMMTSVAALAFRCLQYERELRPTMDEVLEVLKGIESEDYKNVVDGCHGADVVDIPMDHPSPPTPTPTPNPPDSFTDREPSNPLSHNP